MNCKRKVLQFKVRIRNCHILKALNNKLIVFLLWTVKCDYFFTKVNHYYKQDVRLAWTTGKPILLVKSIGETALNPCSVPPPVYHDLTTCHDRPVKCVIVDLPIRLKGNLKCISGNLLSLLVAQSKDVGRVRTGHGKPQKVMEFKTFILQAWKVVEFNCLSLRVMEN